MTLANTRNISLEEMDKNSILHPATSIVDHLRDGPTIMSEGKGIRLTDHTGRKFIDMCGGLWCMNIGYGREEVGEAAARAMGKMGYYHLFASQSNDYLPELADRVLNLLHTKGSAPHLSKMFFGTSGSDANDTNVKLVRYYNMLRGKPEKRKFISRTGAYHGLTYAAASLTGIPAYHKAWDLPLDQVRHTQCPHYYRFGETGETEADYTARLLRELEGIIAEEGAANIAAFIAEPVMGTGGVFIPPAGYFEGVHNILKQNDILFIADEVITGFGRTGSWFSTGAMNLKPDVVTLAKGITSAYFPMSASVISDEIWETLKAASPEWGPVMHGFTYSGHPVGAAVSMCVLDIMEREDLVTRCADSGAYLLQQLKQKIGDHPFIGDIRGEGLMIAIELAADKASRRWFPAEAGAHKIVSKHLREKGIISRALPLIETLGISPAFTITQAEIDEATDLYAEGLKAATPELEKLATV